MFELKDVEIQLGLFREARLPRLQIVLLEFLIEAQRSRRFKSESGKAILLDFEKKKMKRGRVKTDEDLALDAAKQLVSKLSRTLRLYYCERPSDAKDRILIRIEEPTRTTDHRYEPKLTAFRRASTAGQDQRFWPVGDNLAALEYVTKRMSELNRIEETFVRWVVRKTSLYEGSAFQKFLDELKKSKLLYRAVLGPVTDPAIFQDGGLRDTLMARQEDVPPGERAAKVYRLLHNAALMNFTILYYVAEGSDFYTHTDKTEVLFGFGVHEPYEQAGTTIVFRSTEPKLVNEFQELFKALRSGEFSRQLELRQPDQFLEEPRQCDVLATFPELPREQILRKIRASGVGYDEHVKQNSSSAEHIETYTINKPHIKICVSALKLLDESKIKRELKNALQRGVPVSLALWEEGPFLTSRTNVIGIETDDASREIAGSLSAVKFLQGHQNLFVRRCSGELGSVSIIWIDDLIYFSPYWIGKNVAEGPHFLVAASSETGREIREQYNEMLKTSNVVQNGI